MSTVPRTDTPEPECDYGLSLAQRAVRPGSDPRAVDGLRSAMRSIAAAQPENRLRVWTNCATDMVTAVRKGFLSEDEICRGIFPHCFES
jgi:hypothetical protein